MEEEDYISQLPEHLLHHILSFLSIMPIVRTSVLSKKWYHVWNNFPNLEFDFRLLFMQNVFHDGMHELCNSVDQILFSRRKRMMDLNKFTLIFPSFIDRKTQQLVTNTDRWIGYAIDCQVKELDVWVGSSAMCNLPESIYSAQSIRVLQLSGCNLNLPSTGNLRLPLLKTLHLDCVEADEKVIRKFLSGCPLIEDLSFTIYYGIKNLHVFGLFKLKKFKANAVQELDRLKIDSPNLQSLNLHISRPSKLEVSSCKNLKEISLRMVPVKDKWLHELLNNIPLLEYLLLIGCDMLERIKISGDNLRRLNIQRCDKLFGVEIHTPRLCNFSYEGDIILFSLKDSMVSKVELCFKTNNDSVIGTHWYATMVEVLAEFNHSCSVMNLTSENDKDFIVPKDLRQNLAPPLYNIKELNFLFWYKSEKSTTAELVDAMLWTAPHIDSLSIFSRKKSIFKFSYKQSIKSSCYNCVPVSCWWNCIKDVKIKQIHYDGYGRRKEERSYDFEEDVWERIRSGLLDWD